jgi:hypothetical protein
MTEILVRMQVQMDHYWQRPSGGILSQSHESPRYVHYRLHDRICPLSQPFTKLVDPSAGPCTSEVFPAKSFKERPFNYI